MQKQKLKQEIGLNLSPQQIQFMNLLQIPLMSLEKRIEDELESNPVLEETTRIKIKTRILKVAGKVLETITKIMKKNTVQ